MPFAAARIEAKCAEEVDRSIKLVVALRDGTAKVTEGIPANVRLDAAKWILERAGGKPRQIVDVNEVAARKSDAALLESARAAYERERGKDGAQ